jgi:hypothetical protein
MDEYKIEILFFFDMVGATRRVVMAYIRGILQMFVMNYKSGSETDNQIFWREEGHRGVRR